MQLAVKVSQNNVSISNLGELLRVVFCYAVNLRFGNFVPGIHVTRSSNGYCMTATSMRLRRP